MKADFSLKKIACLASVILSLSVSAAPLLVQRANPAACFVTGTVALPAEVADTVPALAQVVTCTSGTPVVTGVPDVASGEIDFSTIDFRKSSSSPLQFALDTFTTPTDPAQADLATLQNQLNTYLAVEAGIRSIGDSSLLSTLKVPKFFLQFQITRVNTANGVAPATEADTTAHQLAKVIKNAPGATAAQLAELNTLAGQT